jgi:hypothetical protein
MSGLKQCRVKTMLINIKHCGQKKKGGTMSSLLYLTMLLIPANLN